MCHSSGRVAGHKELILTRISAAGFCGADCNGRLFLVETRKPRDGVKPSSRGFLSLRSVAAYDIVALGVLPWRASRLRLRRLVSDCTYNAARAKQISKEATTQLWAGVG
jgi:hypothetical protein